MSDVPRPESAERRAAPVVKEVTIETTEMDYVNTLVNATTLAHLRASLVPWARFAPDAVNIATRMSERDFKEFRAGLLAIVGHPDGEGEPTQQYMARWGQLVMPDQLTDASKKADIHGETLGIVLLAISRN